MMHHISVPKWALSVLNNLYDIEKKLRVNGDTGNIKRNIDRMKDLLSEEKLFFEDPYGERFSETRTDLDATITGEGVDNLFVVEVIKPIIRYGDTDYSVVVQKGIVVVQSNGQVSEQE